MTRLKVDPDPRAYAALYPNNKLQGRAQYGGGVKETHEELVGKQSLDEGN